MSKQREAFEVWVKAQDNGATGYEIWQASRAAALEEAAAICEEVPKRHGVHSNFIAAKLIRALKEQS